MRRAPGDRRRAWRRGLRAAWVARADDARTRRLVRDELGVIADRVDSVLPREPTASG